MQTIREAKIIVHLEQGKVELKAPDLSKILADQQKHIDQTVRLTQEMQRLEQAQRAAATAASASGGGGGTTGPRGSGLAPGADEAERAFQRLYTAQMKYLTAQQAIGEGFFLMARAAALFGSDSDDSFKNLIRNLAQVQAYFDVYKGFTNTVRGTVEAIKALQKAELEAAIASGQMSKAQIEALRTSQTLAAGIKMLAIAIADAAVVMIALTSVLAIISSVADILIQTDAEHKASLEGVRQKNIELIRQIDEQIARERQLRDARRANMSDLEKAADMHRAVYRIDAIERQSRHVRFNSDVPGAVEALDSQNREAYSAVSDLQAEVELRREILRAEMAARDAKIDQINQQQKQLEMAQRQLQIEEEKLRTFKAQIGALDPMTLSQLKGIDQKLKAGVDLNQFELETLQKSGGERGQREASKIYAKKFDALGIDEKTFLGGDGGSMDKARTAVDEMTDAVKKLTEGLSANDAVGKLEAEKKSLVKLFDEFKKEQILFIETLFGTIKLNNEELKQIREAIIKDR